MNSGKREIKTLGLSLLTALGLLTVTATAALAGGEFKLKGSTFAASGLASESVSGTAEASKFLVPGPGLTIACTSNDLLNVTAYKGGTVEGTVISLGCAVEGNKFCKIYPTNLDKEKGTRVGEIEASGLGELLLMGGNHYLLVSNPIVIIGGIEVNVPFTKIFFTSASKGCTLPSEEAISGSTVLELPGALASQVNQTVATISQSTLGSLFPAERLEYGHETASLDGGLAKVHLAGKNANAEWSAE